MLFLTMSKQETVYKEWDKLQKMLLKNTEFQEKNKIYLHLNLKGKQLLLNKTAYMMKKLYPYKQLLKTKMETKKIFW